MAVLTINSSQIKQTSVCASGVSACVRELVYKYYVILLSYFGNSFCSSFVALNVKTYIVGDFKKSIVSNYIMEM